MSCIGQPVSWMMLEQFNLKELSPEETRRVAEHLKSCPACAACAQSIENDTRTLPALPPIETVESRPLITWPRLAMAAGAAMAAVLVVLLTQTQVPDKTAPPADRIGYKGGEPAITLVQERNGVVVENPTVYLSGDRFRLMATIPDYGEVKCDVVLFQSGEVYFPLERQETLEAGNNIPIPGAFRLTGSDPTEICLFVGKTLPAREVIKEKGKKVLPKRTVCQTLQGAKGDKH